MNSLRAVKLEATLGPRWHVGNLNLELQSGDCAFVVGENGSGKSTALRLIAGLYPATKGELELNYDDDPVPRKHWRRHVSFLPETFNFPPRQKVEDVLKYFLRLRGASSAEAKSTISNYFNKWKLTPYLELKTNECSVGILQQIKVALVLMNPTPLILLDEPLESLDPKAQTAVWRQIKGTLDDGAMMIVSLFTQWTSTVKPKQVVRFKEGKATTFDNAEQALKEYEKDLADSH